MSSSSLGKLSFKEQGLRYKLFIIGALIFVLPFLIVSYLFHKNNVDLELSQLVLLSFIFILILGGFIILRQIFHRFVMVANLIEKAEARDGYLIDMQKDTTELHEITVSFNRLMKKFQEATAELKHRVFELFAIKELTEIASKTLDIDDLLNVLLEKAMAVSKARIGSVYIVETEKGRFRVVASRGLESGPQKNTYISINDSLARLVVSDKKPLLVQDIETDSRICRANDPRYGPPSFLSVPIFVRDDLIAVLNLSHKETEQALDSNDEQILSIIIGEVGLALENAKLHSKIEEHVKNLQERTEALTSTNDQLQREVAERKRSEEEKEKLKAQLQRVQKMEAIGTLAGGIAHDFNNILSAIIGYTELSRYDLPEESKVQANLEAVFKAGIRAKDLVQQILTFSRQTEPEKKPLRIATIIQEALKLLRASLPTTIDIRQNIKSTSDIVLANPTRIHQVLMNLCTNAAHAMREKGGVLEVSLEDVDIEFEAAAQNPDLNPGAYVKLTVSDTGSGIEPEIIGRIFDPYFSTREPDQGSGMGLAVVHGVVKSTGGAITVDSKLGEGTSMQVFLPKIEGEPAPEPRAFGPFPSGSERILFVDDEKALVDIGAQMLERLGYQVVFRTSSIEALEAFRKQAEKFDLVITDQTMPNMTGEMLAKELIQIRPDIPIILCTGYSEVMSEEKAKTLGIRKLVMKPIVIHEMGETIRQILDQRDEKKT